MAERQRARVARLLHAGNRPHALGDRVEVGEPSLLRWIVQAVGQQAHRQDLSRIEPGVHAQHAPVALAEEANRQHDHERQRQFAGDQAVDDRPVRAMARRGRTDAQHRGRAARIEHRRQQAEDERRDDGRGDAEEEDRRVRGELANARNIGRAGPRDDADRHPGRGYAEHAGRCRENRALDEQLAHELPARGA